MARCWLVVLGLAVGAPARADRCVDGSWRASQGTVTAGPGCPSVIVTADPGAGRARALLDRAFARDGTIEVALRGLDARIATLQIDFSGNYLLLRDGQFGLYIDEASWSTTGWRALPAPLAGWRVVDPARVTIVLADNRVIARLDGHELGQWVVPTRPRTGALSIWFTGPRGARSRVEITAWSVPAP